MRQSQLLFATLLLFLATSTNAALLGPSSYVQSADSPFASIGGFDYFYLETFEDGFNTPGVAGTGSGLCVVFIDCFTTPNSNQDSVDEDNGLIDGSGLNASSHWASGTITYTFDATVLGALPTHVGIVWTDGSNPITFTAYDELGNSLGSLIGNHADGNFLGGTAEDRFYGVDLTGFSATGISKITIGNPGGIEVDHLQYGCLGDSCEGANGIPIPTTLALIGLGLAGMGYKRSKIGAS